MNLQDWRKQQQEEIRQKTAGPYLGEVWQEGEEQEGIRTYIIYGPRTGRGEKAVEVRTLPEGRAFCDACKQSQCRHIQHVREYVAGDMVRCE